MAVTTTPLGFQKPDGTEMVRDGDNIISANAQKAEDMITADRGRLSNIEAKNTQQDTDIANAHTNAVADAKTYTDGVVAADRVRLTAIEGSAVPAWKTATAYTAGQRVIAPNGDVVTAIANHTSTTYVPTNWTPSSQDGRIGATESKNTAQDTRLDANDANLYTGDFLKGSDSRAQRQIIDTTYALPFADQNGYVSGGVQSDGAWNFEKGPRVKGQDVTMRPLNTTGWAIPFADQDGYVAGGIRPDGSAEFSKLNLSAANLLAVANAAVGYTKSSRTRIAAIGDSLTDGYFGGVGNQDADSYPAKLQALMPAGVTVFNLGNSGYTTDEEAVRIGAIPLPLVVTGGSIPADTSAVTVTTTAVIGWRPTGTVRTIPGTLAGVPGTLTRNASDTVFSFARTTAGTATTVPDGTVFVPDFAGHDGDTAIILLGRNNVSYSVKGPDTSIGEHVAKGIARIVAWMTPQVKQVLVVSATTQTSETSGTGGYATVLDINTRLAAAYPSRYLDLRSYLVNQAIYDLGLTPTTADNAAMTGDTLPPSIMDGGTDNTHWSKNTAVLVAGQINNYLTTRGWI